MQKPAGMASLIHGGTVKCWMMKETAAFWSPEQQHHDNRRSARNAGTSQLLSREDGGRGQCCQIPMHFEYPLLHENE